MVIAFIIWSFVTLLFVIIGVVGYKSKEAVGFFASVKPPIIKDVEKYNHSVGILWIVAAIIFEIIGASFLFIEQNSPIALLIVLAVMVWAIGLMIGYFKIEKKFRK